MYYFNELEFILKNHQKDFLFVVKSKVLTYVQILGVLLGLFQNKKARHPASFF